MVLASAPSIDKARPQAVAPATSDRDRRLTFLVGDHYPFVWRVLRRLGLSEADADDAAQQVFLNVSRRLDDIRTGSERAFLFRTAVHVASKAHRSRRRRRETTEGDCADWPDQFPPADALLDQRRARALLDAMLHELPDELRDVVVLFEIEGLGKIEVAEALNIPPGTVASRLRRARQAISELVARHQARSRFRGSHD
jgi:RNA polymerase sigma-70 factor (ECF subfamily)